MSRHSYIAIFADEAALLRAARACKANGLTIIDAWSPFPVHGIDEVLDIRPSRLPWVTLAGGLTGLAGALWFQYWSSGSSWPLNVGGKPFDSLPAFVPIAFESLILIAGLATAFALFARSRLRPGKTVQQVDPRVTDDRFALRVERRSAALDDRQLAQLWSDAGAIDSWTEVVA